MLAHALLGVPAAFSAPGDLVRFERAKDQFRKGVHFFNKRQYLASVEFFRNAVSIYPDYHTAREYLARSYKYSGFVNEALSEWETLAELNPDNVYIRNRIDTLRFRTARGEVSADLSDFVLSDQIISAAMKRFRFPEPVDIAMDAEKNVYITSFSSGKISKIDPNGKGVTTFAPSIKSMLFGIASNGNTLAVSDFKAGCVYLLDTSCRVKSSFGKPGNADGQFRGPEGVCFDKKDNLYVVDSGNDRVQKFRVDGSFILKFGTSGEYEGQLNGPTGVAVMDKKVYVTDTGNRRISCFDEYGNFISVYTNDRLEKPRGISAHARSLMVSDERNGLMIFDPDTGKSGWFDSWDSGNQRFSRLYSSRFDRDGLLYCLDYAYRRVFVFTPSQVTYSNLDVEITSVEARDYPTVAVFLNVRNRSGGPIYALRKENFRVTEDDAPVARLGVDYLKTVNQSASIVLCVDRSVENRVNHAELPWAAEFVLKNMRRNDRIKLVNFNSDYWMGSDFDWSRRRTLEALRENRYGAGRNIGAALYNAVTDLIHRESRRGVVLLTAGPADSQAFQQYSAQYVAEYARSHYIPIYIVTFRDRDPVLAKIARDTGGDIFRVQEIDGLRRIYDRIRGSEEYRYVLLYRSYKLPSFKGWWSDIRIELNYRGQRGFEWGGYFVP